MLFDPKMFIPFVNGENYQNFDLVSKFKFFNAYLRGYCEKYDFLIHPKYLGSIV